MLECRMYKVYKGVDQGCCLGEHLNVLGTEMKFLLNFATKYLSCSYDFRR
jgi:hypothetical protein